MDLEQKRLTLHEQLREILGIRNCYHTPPTNTSLRYPCVIYDLAGSDIKPADNIPYFTTLKWSIIVVDEDPDSKIAGKMFEFPGCHFDRKLKYDNLNHFYFSLYF